jgi:ribosomal protein L11 methyltransferase
MAELSEAHFEAFIETENGFEAYVEGAKYDEMLMEEIWHKYEKLLDSLSFTITRLEKKNWNEEWEKNYEPIVIGEKCLIRAVFHKPQKKYPYEIIITPKMSFGTGHHQTTRLMITAQLEMNHQGKRVMDAGCGTAVLSIMASKLGAEAVDAFDVDEWSIVNGKENVEINGCHNITIRKGTVRDLTFMLPFDIVLANINKNILLHEMEIYRLLLAEDGQLLISGFYTEDIPDIRSKAHKFQLVEVARFQEDDWAALWLTMT